VPAQVVSQEEGGAGLDQLRAEYVVRIRGELRPRKDPNPRLPTGMVELVAQEVCRKAPWLCKP
jgi:aspartyl-tRNA synthetase